MTTQPEDIAWVMPRLVPQPFRTFSEPVTLRTSAASRPPRSYIRCIGDRPRGGPRIRHGEGINDYHEIRTGHDAMVTAPREIADLLTQLAAQTSD